MSTTEVPSDSTDDAGVGRADMKLEAVVIPVSDVDRAKGFYESLGVEARRRLRLRQRFPGRPVHAARVGVLGSVRHEPDVGGARVGPGPVPGRLRHQRLRATISPRTASRRARCSTPEPRALSSSPTGRAVASAGRRRITPATARSPRSATRTATAGCCRRSRRGYPAGSTLAETAFGSASDLASARFGGRRPPTASTRSAPGQRDANWPEWYAAYMVAEQAGDELPS